MSVKVRVRGVKGMERRLRRVGPELLDESVKYGIKRGKGNAPVRTGQLAASIRLLRPGRTSALFGTKLSYAKYVEYGRGPVRPKRAKALRFKAGGSYIYVKYARPTKGKYFMRRTE